MLDLFVEVYRLARPSGLRKLATTMLLILMQAIMQTLAIFSLMPFLGAAADVTAFRRSILGQNVIAITGDVSDSKLLFIVGMFALVVLVLGNVSTLVADYARSRYAFMITNQLRISLMRNLLDRKYEYFLRTNTGVLIKHTTEDVYTLASHLLLPALDMIARVLLVLFMATAVAIIAPTVLLGGAVVVLVYYLSVVRVIKGKAHQASDQIKIGMRNIYLEITQTLNGVKPILASGTQEHFVGRMSGISERLSNAMASTSMFAAIPRSGLEVLVFGGMILWVLFAIASGENLSTLIPRLGIIAVVSYRLMPSLQLIFAQIGAMSASRQAIEEIRAVFDEQEAMAAIGAGHAGANAPRPIVWHKEIRFDSVSFQYEMTNEPALKDLNLTIPKGGKVAFVGPTGSGKSTLVDLLLGLHVPTGGRILVDGEPLTRETMPAWRRATGYVPQDFFMLDGTVAENVAFGVDAARVDEARVDAVTTLAQASDFVKRRDSDGNDAVVGERGVRLSGGQRQRLALARALYAEPNLLILDEATSALDPKTEARVVAAMAKEVGELTIVTITHRLDTVKDYDCIFYLEHGRILCSGDFKTLVAENPRFRDFTHG
ncbi:MAG: ABC transporter ATP-binding protein [Novosphingobium sp.]